MEARDTVRMQSYMSVPPGCDGEDRQGHEYDCGDDSTSIHHVQRAREYIFVPFWTLSFSSSLGNSTTTYNLAPTTAGVIHGAYTADDAS